VVYSGVGEHNVKATAAAHPNIALVKYWGKRDQDLVLPYNSSVSMVLDGPAATTTVEFGKREADAAQIDGRFLEGEALKRVTRILDLVRARAGITDRARVYSKTDFPKSVGLASSSAGFAALAAASAWAAGLDLPPRELSVLARMGSGSAARSIEGGFSEWRRGEKPDGEDSVATQIAPAAHWEDLRMVIAVCTSEPKLVSSREGMQRCVETSPYFEAWTRCAEADVAPAKAAILARNLETLGHLAERNAFRMHACALAADPPIQYMLPATLAVIDSVMTLRAGGAPAYFTLDAGPNPVVLIEASKLSRLEIRLGSIKGIERLIPCAPGRGVQRSERHLF
jgi:diphosphomevalonate decarboxylase